MLASLRGFPTSTLGVCQFVLSLVVIGGCQLPANPCRVDTSRCNGDELQRCTGHPGGFYGGGIDDTHHTSSSDPTWDHDATCAPGACITSKTKADRAFCALSGTPSPACSADGSVCEGSTLLQCSEEYVLARTACRTCNASTFTCVGQYGNECRTSGDCAAELTCDPTRVPASCGKVCSCPEGVACSACDVISGDTEGKTFTWICSNARCTEKF